MSAVITTPEDIINAALKRIGVKQRIGKLLEGSEWSKAALDIYGQERDNLLRDGDWQFARRDVALAVLKTGPVGGYYGGITWTSTYPPIPYKFEYAYPVTDCLKIRSIKRTPMFGLDYSPKANPFTIYNDNALVPAQKTILCDVPNAIAVYTGQVTNPSLWEVSFVEALIGVMAARLAPTMNPQMLQPEAADATNGVGEAKMQQG